MAKINTQKGTGKMNKLRFKELRNKKGMRQEDVAKILQIERTTYGRHETGEREMTYAALGKLADFYGCSVDFLLGRIDGDCVMLNSKEVELLGLFRKVDERGKATAVALLTHECERKKPPSFGGFA